MTLAGCSVLVTGASRGIGRAAAVVLAGQGARIGVHYRQHRSAAEETLSSLAGDGHVLLQADVSDPDAAHRLVDEAAARLGGLHVLINNAGVFHQHPPMEVSYERWLEAWRTTIQTNLTGAANVAFRAAQVMVQKGGGRIISVSSRGAFRGEPDAPAYGASKAGLNAFSQSMARALASQRVFFFAVAPGWVKTDMAEPHLSGEEGNDIRRQSPLGRIATADEVARLILFLAGEAPATMTGCIVDINGASYLRT